MGVSHLYSPMGIVSQSGGLCDPFGAVFPAVYGSLAKLSPSCAHFPRTSRHFSAFGALRGAFSMHSLAASPWGGQWTPYGFLKTPRIPCQNGGCIFVVRVGHPCASMGILSQAGVSDPGGGSVDPLCISEVVANAGQNGGCIFVVGVGHPCTPMGIVSQAGSQIQGGFCGPPHMHH